MLQLNVTKIDLSKSIPLKNPLVIHLELTNKCNFSCQYCPESLEDFNERVGGAKSMSREEFEKIVMQIKQLGKVSVLRLWIMGEPLLNPNLYDFIKIAKLGGVADEVEITTNASLLTEANSIKLIDSGIDTVKISIYGFGSSHQEVTSSRVPSTKIYDQICLLRKLRDSKKSKTKIVIKMVDPRDAKELSMFQDMYSPIADKLDIFSPHSWVETYSISTFESRNMNKSILSERKKLKPKTICAFPFYTLAIHANGDVSVCCVDWEKKTKLGNVNTETLTEMWNGEVLKNIRKKHLLGLKKELPGCSSCDYFYDNCAEDLDDSAVEILDKII